MLKLRENGFVEYARRDKAVLKLRNSNLYAVIIERLDKVILNHVVFSSKCEKVINECPPYALDASIDKVVSTKVFDSMTELEAHLIVSDMYCSQF